MHRHAKILRAFLPLQAITGVLLGVAQSGTMMPEAQRILATWLAAMLAGWNTALLYTLLEEPDCDHDAGPRQSEEDAEWSALLVKKGPLE